ncbi:13295_t:CDS:2, partial [Racocetra fulgida]
DDFSNEHIAASSSSGNVCDGTEVKRKRIDEGVGSTYPVTFICNELVKNTKAKNDELRNLFIRNDLITAEGKFTIQKPELVNLPILSGNNLQLRFHTNEDKLPFIYRKNCIKIFNRVMDLIEETNSLYIHGPSGSG